jgi:RNA polymerase sigma factor (sigma-70 family)
MPRTLNQLMIAVQNDEPDAMTELFNVLQPRLAGFFVKCGAPDSDVDDLLQLTLIKVWKSKDRFKPESQTASAWILTIGKNLLRDHVRHVTRKCRGGDRKHVSIEQVEVLTDKDSAPELAERAEIRSKVRNAVRRLPGETQGICRMHLKGASSREIAERFDCTGPKVLRQIVAAKNLLRKKRRLVSLALQ